ncbi:MAG: carboxypeptidase regulatory-like domain-containing protein, partial [Firmicutes bacterium]|nr:carboxypeptidase regulatory-like domain-containing protein [Bacillota bacterium]
STGGFTGRIKDNEGKSPFPAAYTVYSYKGLPIFTKFIDQDGTFGFTGLPGGEYFLQIGAPGFLPVVETFPVFPGRTTTLEMVLLPGELGFPLAGRIVTRGHPASGAVVRVFDLKERPLGLVLTDEEGRFLFPFLPPGELLVVVSGPGIAARAFTVTLPVDGHWEGEVKNDPCRFLKRFADENGHPIEDAAIRITETASGHRLFTVLTNREGFFWIRAWSFSAPSPPWRWSCEGPH